MNIHRKYMLRCLQIANNGLGSTAPNPMVGCVIVVDQRIIGEGFTSAYGGPHAEVNAINSVSDKTLLKKATLYVTLEPCSHFGKTPPCADLIIKHSVKKVVIGLLNPHEKVAGQGIEKLKSAGIEVVTNVLEAECREHHKRFLTFQEKKRPYIILKWAQTSNGYIAPIKELRSENPEPFWITDSYSKQLVHQWRSQEQGILVGAKTVIEDNPKLNVREWSGKNPLRLILDPKLRIDQAANVLDDTVRTIIFTDSGKGNKNRNNTTFVPIDYKADVAGQICRALHKENIISVLIEGGSKTLQTFIDSGLWDEARVFTGNTTFKDGLRAPQLSGRHLSKKQVGRDTLNIYRND